MILVPHGIAPSNDTRNPQKPGTSLVYPPGQVSQSHQAPSKQAAWFGKKTNQITPHH